MRAVGGVQQPVTNGTAGTKPKLSRKDRIRAKKEAKKLARQADSDDDDLAISGDYGSDNGAMVVCDFWGCIPAMAF